MFKPKKEEKDSTPNNETIVGETVKLEGNINSEENISIFGQVIGKIKTEKNIKIGENAEIKGDVIGENITIAGKIEGNVVAKEKIEILSSGKVLGDINTKSLLISLGAIFNGQCSMETEKNLTHPSFNKLGK